MFSRQSQISSSSKRKTNKLIAGFAALAVTTIVTASGFAAATSAVDKPSKEDCRRAGYTNYGQCVKEWARDKNRPGNGYGGGNNSSINTNLNLALNNSNGNIIHIIVNIFR